MRPHTGARFTVQVVTDFVTEALLPPAAETVRVTGYVPAVREGVRSDRACFAGGPAVGAGVSARAGGR